MAPQFSPYRARTGPAPLLRSVPVPVRSSPLQTLREAADYLLYACIPLRYSTVSGELLSHFSRGMLRKTHSMGIRGRNGFPVSRDVHVGSAQLDQNGLLDPADLLRQPLEEKGLRLGRPGG
jgi:hypothetical protein